MKSRLHLQVWLSVVCKKAYVLHIYDIIYLKSTLLQM